MAAASPAPSHYWEVLVDGGSYVPMSAANTAHIEAAYAGNLPTCKTRRGKWSYTIDLNAKTQTNDGTKAVRAIRRCPAATAGGGVWEVLIDGGRWVRFEPPIQAILNNASSAGQTSVSGIRIKQHSYTMDLVSMKQINMATQKQRDIRLGAGSVLSTGAAPGGLEGSLSYDMGQGDVDYQSVTRWKRLRANQDYDPNTDCSIMCVPLGDGIADPVVRLCCSTPQMPCVFQQKTIEQCLGSNPTCPSCGKQFDIPGAQPSGSMNISLEQGIPCEGFPGTGTFHLTYSFPGGVQHKRMPKPGQRFGGTSREVYIPGTPEGREAVQLLKLGFQRGFLFIVGKSVTTGQDDVVVWAGIHQKTSRSGGATNHGWPDDTAFHRLKSECAARGITL